MSGFAAATAVRQAAEPGWYDVDLHDGWVIGGKPNGGYLLATTARAGCQALGALHPRAVSGHFLRVPDPGPARVRVEVVRSGRRVSTARATLWQGDRPCLEVLLSAGSWDGVEEEWTAAPAPDLPAPEDCRGGQPPGFRVELMDHVDLRLDPATAPFPTPSGTAELRGWLRLADGTEPDPLVLVLAVDATPPAVLNLGRGGWAPTVELTALVRGVPAAGWLRFQVLTRSVAGGWFDEDATLWDSTGRLVAQSRQLGIAGS